MKAPLDAETKRLRKFSDGDLADEVGKLKAGCAAIEKEALRRGLLRATGVDFKIILIPPAISQRSDKALLLQVMGITEAEYISRFCHPVQTGWRMTCSAIKKFPTAV